MGGLLYIGLTLLALDGTGSTWVAFLTICNDRLTLCFFSVHQFESIASLWILKKRSANERLLLRTLLT